MKTGWIFLLAALALGIARAHADDSPRPIRVGLTATYLHDQYPLHEDWRRYMERKLERPVVFVRRDSYDEMMDLLRQNKLEFAWICDYPYVDNRNLVRLLAVPSYKGHPVYRSYVIVPAGDKTTKSILDLRNRVFAYTDPYSNTGYLTPRYLLKQAGENPAHFFEKTFFARSHRKVVEAVANGLADGGAVGSFIWDTLEIIQPELAAATRVVSVSDDYGMPPFVANRAVREAEFQRMQKMLFEMAADSEGRALLKRLNVNHFSKGDPRNYERVSKVMKALGDR